MKFSDSAQRDGRYTYCDVFRCCASTGGLRLLWDVDTDCLLDFEGFDISLISDVGGGSMDSDALYKKRTQF